MADYRTFCREGVNGQSGFGETGWGKNGDKPHLYRCGFLFVSPLPSALTRLERHGRLKSRKLTFNFMRGKHTQIIIIVLGLLIVVGVGYAWANRSSDQKGAREAVAEPATEKPDINTSDWKTYRNEEYGFSFRYPKDKILTEKKAELGLELLIGSSDPLRKEGAQIFVRDRKKFDVSGWLKSLEEKKDRFPYHYENIGSYRVVVENDVIGEGPLVDSYSVVLDNTQLGIGTLRSDKNRDLVENIIVTLKTL